MVADDALLESMKGVEIVNFGCPLMPSQKWARPEIDKVIPERPGHTVSQAIAGLPQQIRNEDDKRHDNVATGDLIDKARRRRHGMPM
ncbi:MAG: hypothetical protein ABSE22_21455 [Xanthobacteraceae bacterium]